ncbi:sialidase family protein [Vibrio marisflavi]|nr:hypothetical protein [Vibrio marisflavi]
MTLRIRELKANQKIMLKPITIMAFAFLLSGCPKNDPQDYNALYAVGGPENTTLYDVGYTIVSSSDGVSWDRVFSNKYANTLYAISYGGNRYLAVGDDVYSMTSTNGKNWSSLAGPSGGSARDIIYAHDKFIVIGETGMLAILSPDSTDWLYPNTGASAYNLNGITHAKDKLVVVGGEKLTTGMIMTSSDGGNTWSLPELIAGKRYLNDITYGRDLFVAVGHKTILISDNAEPDSWTTIDFSHFSLAPNFHAVTYANNVFVAVGSQGLIFTSSDGKTWQEQALVTTVDLRGVTYSSDQFVVTGDDGTILTSPDGNNWSSQESNVSVQLTHAFAINGS